MVNRGSVIVVGVGAATASVVLAATMGFALVYECGGGEGSGGVDSTAWICSGPLDQAVSLAAFGVSLAAPVLGLGFSFKHAAGNRSGLESARRSSMSSCSTC